MFLASRALCLQAMVKQNSLPIVWVKERPARIGLVPKQAKSTDAIKWFEMPRSVVYTFKRASQSHHCPACVLHPL
eukprot:scaffold15312_cov30-Tisochrysis_lutea.AAC.1